MGEDQEGGPLVEWDLLAAVAFGHDTKSGHCSGLTKREYAAIHLCVPMSGNEELDKMINAARMDRFAMVALANYQGAKRAFEIADEMLAASKGEK